MILLENFKNFGESQLVNIFIRMEHECDMHDDKGFYVLHHVIY